MSVEGMHSVNRHSPTLHECSTPINSLRPHDNSRPHQLDGNLQTPKSSLSISRLVEGSLAARPVPNSALRNIEDKLITMCDTNNNDRDVFFSRLNKLEEYNLDTLVSKVEHVDNQYRTRLQYICGEITAITLLLNRVSTLEHDMAAMYHEQNDMAHPAELNPVASAIQCEPDNQLTQITNAGTEPQVGDQGTEPQVED